ncbi:single stranded DNA-binding protein [Escherichia coli]|nr:single stranded DNA-binding protein [Escherichia coli]
MTAQIAAYGRLVDDPQVKQTSKGTPMTLARMASPFRAARQMTERLRYGYR